MTFGILIAGGGLAGTAAGCMLAAAGEDVTIIERETGPTHKICGEFLSIEAQAYLREIGFDVAALGGHSISQLRLTRCDESIDTKLPFLGLGISRHALDEALLKHAAASGAKLMRGCAVSNITCDGSVQMADGQILQPKTLFLATGKHDIRGLRRPHSDSEALVGFKMHFLMRPLATMQLKDFISLILFRDGYAGIQLIENDHTNLCLLIKRERLRRLGGKWPDLLADLCRECPYLARLLDGATPLLPQPLTIYRVPYGYVHKPRGDAPKAMFRLGDQAAVIPSFTGDGMAIALHTARLASTMYLRGASAEDYHSQLANDVSAQIRRAGALWGLARHQSTHALFFHLVRLLPKMLSIAAGATRIPERARLAM
jgi:flavin-dependent dehydrogenase